MIKICYKWGHNKTREYHLIKQGLKNNPRVELVNSEKKSDFVFQLAYHRKKRYDFQESSDPKKTVIIDYHDNPRWIFLYDEEKHKHWRTQVLTGEYKHSALAYFKRAWVDVDKKSIKWPANFHPITFAIMDEFIIEKDFYRNIVLSCSLREEQRNQNRASVLQLLRKMKIWGNTSIGRYNKGAMDGFNDANMRGYFNLLRRSRIVVTCNPDKWEGDHRTWEALASGALVFVDKMHTPLTYPLVNGLHCVFYDTTERGLINLRDKILYFLKETDHASEIAKYGHDFAMTHHRASNRIDEILDVIT